MPWSLFGAVRMEDGLPGDVIGDFLINAHVQIITGLVGEEHADWLSFPVGAAAHSWED